MMRAWLAVLLALAVAATADARTWRVEKNGSGDFTVIQDAIDGAAEGDTVRVGPGRFDDFRAGASTVDGFQFQMIAWITTDELTLIGAGMDQTLIGPATVTEEVLGEPAGCLYIDGGVTASVSECTFENTQGIVTLRNTVIMSGCRIRSANQWFGMGILGGTGIQLKNSVFEGVNAILTGSPQAMGLTIQDCQFYGLGPSSYSVVIGNGATDARILDCDFYGSAVGVSVQLSGSASIEDCGFLGIQVVAIDLSQGAAIVRRCRIDPGARFPLRVNNGLLEVYNSVIGGGELATILVAGDMIVRNSNILNGGALSVDSRGSASRVVDLAQNWWGTTDLQQIESWISQLNPNVVYQPILDKPVSTEVKSFSHLKAYFAPPPAGDGN